MARVRHLITLLDVPYQTRAAIELSDTEHIVTVIPESGRLVVVVDEIQEGPGTAIRYTPKT